MNPPMTPTPAASAKEKARGWRYSINYGPEGEANYAMVYDAEDVLVSNLKTYHAIAVVNAMNAALSATEGEAEGWRPIESAPENEWVLAWSGKCVEMACLRDGRWLVANSYGVTINPTAWRPLPEPPTMLSAGGEG